MITKSNSTCVPYTLIIKSAIDVNAAGSLNINMVKLTSRWHCPDSARTQGANERVVLCLMNELVADHERVL